MSGVTEYWSTFYRWFTLPAVISNKYKPDIQISSATMRHLLYPTSLLDSFCDASCPTVVPVRYHHTDTDTEQTQHRRVAVATDRLHLEQGGLTNLD